MFYKRPKWGNKKTEYNGRKFDSKLECERFKFLEILASNAFISNLSCQYPVTLLEAFKTKTNAKFRPMTYKADFKYEIPSMGIVVLEDAKGYETPEFKLKRKLLEHKLLEEQDTYFVIVSKPDEEVTDPREITRVIPKKRRARKKPIEAER